jgi:PadR family transcriptional regulator AphA
MLIRYMLGNYMINWHMHIVRMQLDFEQIPGRDWPGLIVFHQYLNESGNGMNVRSLCLAILNMSDATGYEIRKLSTEAEYSYFVDASFGSIYPALNKLEADSMVTCRLEAQVGKPARKIYSITAAGRQEFRDSLKIPPQKDLFKSEFLLLAMNANFVDRETLQIAIDQRFVFLREELAIMLDAGNCSEHDGMRWIASYGRYVHEASLKFLEENQQELLAMTEPRDIGRQAAE